jgi:hypothetical protein
MKTCVFTPPHEHSGLSEYGIDLAASSGKSRSSKIVYLIDIIGNSIYAGKSVYSVYA